MALKLSDIYQPMEFHDTTLLRRLVSFVVSHQPRGPGSRAGLAPDLQSEVTQEPRVSQREPTYFCIDPYDLQNIGTVAFDFRLGGLVAKSNIVYGSLSEEEFMQLDPQELSEGDSFTFERDPFGDKVYYFLSHERVEGSNDLELHIHAKSTTGRVGAHVKGVGRTKSGNLITLLQPMAFNLLARSGETSFAQGVVRYAGTSYATPEQIRQEEYVTFDGKTEGSLNELGAFVRFDTSNAYAAKNTREPIDMSARGTLDPKEWWEEISGNSELILDGRRLYLLGSKGVITMGSACGIISKEQETFSGLGGFGCLAGVMQPGFKGEITMEPFFPNATRIQKGDVAGQIIIDPVKGEIPNGGYGGDYQGQKAPRLPKMFGDF